MGTAALGAQTASVQPRASVLARWMLSGRAKWWGMALGLSGVEAGALMVPDQSGTRLSWSEAKALSGAQRKAYRGEATGGLTLLLSGEGVEVFGREKRLITRRGMISVVAVVSLIDAENGHISLLAVLICVIANETRFVCSYSSSVPRYVVADVESCKARGTPLLLLAFCHTDAVALWQEGGKWRWMYLLPVPY